jgi:protoporphyrinogen oxidase
MPFCDEKPCLGVLSSSGLKEVLIIGGGLTGLSTALHLQHPEQSQEPIRHDAHTEAAPQKPGIRWRLFEQASRPGGHARTETIRGFYFDKTGHWLHLRDPGIKSLIGKLFPGDTPGRALLPVARKARIFSHGSLIRYPFQANLQGLPPSVISECLLGFISAHTARLQAGENGLPPVADFEAFCLQQFGPGIARHFMIPYNAKLWGVHPREITSAWCSRFVPIPSLDQVVRGAVGDNPPELGYNAHFLYPAQGGIESLVQRLLSRLPADRMLTGAGLEEVHLKRQEAVIAGERIPYQALVATLPLPELCRRIVDLPTELADWAARLRCTPVRYLNVATRVPPRADYHWLYVPEEQYPFYRVGVYTNAVPSMAPAGCGSLYVELSERGEAPDMSRLMPQVAEALVAAGVLGHVDDILFAELREIEYAYVVFDHAYYDAMAKLVPFLEAHQIFPRGRYGSWTYNSMEDCLMLGRDVARLLYSQQAPALQPS